MSEAVHGFEFDDGERERLWSVVTQVRDASPRRPDDAATDDIVDALLPVVGDIVARRIAAGGADADAGWHDAGLETWRAWNAFAHASTQGESASAFLAVSDAVAQLGTWLPGYDPDTGMVTDPDEEAGDDGAGHD